MKNDVFWWNIDGNLESKKINQLPKSIDFVIVGGGYTGLSAGHYIAKQGKSVVVLDSGKPGFGASTRNGGICSGQVRITHKKLTERFGKEFANKVYSEAVDARHDLKKFCNDEKIDCDLQMSGRFTGAMSKKDFENQIREVELLNNLLGHKAYMVNKNDQNREVNTNLFFGGMIREEIGGFHPGKFFSGLLNRTEKAGVLVISDTIVFEIKDISESIKHVSTSRGIIKTEKVIIATNAYTGTKFKFGEALRKKIVPVKSAIIVTEKLGKNYVKKLMPTLRMYGNTANLYSYFRPTPDNDRILLGSRGLENSEVSIRTLKYLKTKLSLIFPDLKNCKIDYCWEGNVCFTRSQLPTIFEKRNIYYSAGYAGSGTVWATWLGKKVAQIATGTTNKPSVFFGPPPKNFPFYNGNPWFLPAIQYYFSIKDKLKS